MRGFFVTGTDTGVGKTVAAAAIVAALRERGVAVRVLKPVITGLDEPPDPVWPPDHELLARAAGCAVEAVTLTGYGPPVSPHLAAELSGRPVGAASLRAGVLAAAARADVLIVEGVGGLLVPFGDGDDVRALARDIGLPLVIAARPGLGTINHTLLTVEAARSAGLEIAAIVLTPWPTAPDTIERSNRDTIERVTGIPVSTLRYIERPSPALLAAAARDLPVERWFDLQALQALEVPTGPRASLAAIDTEELIAADRRHLWHPFTQQQTWCEDEPPIVIERGEGTTLYDTDGNAYIDGVSSLWCNVHGHHHPAIDGAVRDQLDRVAHSTMLGLSHRPAVELAEKLIAVVPPGLTRVFYSDSGSSAVEVALKMAFQWWAHAGETGRTTFVCLEDAYHGDTLGAVSVGGIQLFHSIFGPLLFDTVKVRAGDAEHLAATLERHAGSVAAVVVEPLVQGAAGMLMAPDGYLRRVRELCDRHGLPLICDEVATGFGRTGAMFACEHERVTPDLLCVGKGLTGGYLPLSATITTERIYERFLGREDELRTFFHGHTYTGNPLACAAGIATLETFERERTLELLAPKIELLARLLDQRVRPLGVVAEVRRRGFMVGIELSPRFDGEPLGRRVTLAARRRGAIIRPLGDVIVLMPPLSIEETELSRLVAITAEAIDEAAADRLSTAA
ncbi:MAG TPA: adenosylmethionine--8-amino-7-oxononanoate transaminase [Solirubrobacteraceae bacterium]|nr:adenosylmethionine--8-amino-7-oxononanoate transaminase [Solirubrobacteraceae bacterium]